MPSLILTDSYPPAPIVPLSKDPHEIQLLDSDDDNNEDNESNDDGEANVHEADKGDANDHTDVGCKDKDGHWENDFDNNDTHSNYRFEDYNLGSLFKHPMILNILNNDEMTIINVNEMMTSCDVLSLLLDYLTECRWNNNNNYIVKSNSNDNNNYNKNDYKNSNRHNNDTNNKNKRTYKNMPTTNNNFAQEFSNYICHKIEITNLFHVGIILKGNLQHEILTLQHIVNNRMDSIISINKAELEYYNHRENGYENSSSSSKPFYYHDYTCITSNTSTSLSSSSATTTAINKGFNNIEYTKISKNKKRLKPSTMDSSNYDKNNNSSSRSSSRYDTLNVYHDKNKDYDDDDDDSISIIDNSILRALCPYPNSTTTSTASYNNDNNNNHHHTTSSSDLNNYDIGKWGEALVYQYLLMTRGGSRKEGGISGEEKKNKNNSNKMSKICSSSCCNSSSSSSNSNNCDVIIHWLNEDIESRAGYDITITNNQLQHSKDYRTYIEVKSTRYINKNSFEISLWEWQFLNSPSQV